MSSVVVRGIARRSGYRGRYPERVVVAVAFCATGASGLLSWWLWGEPLSSEWPPEASVVTLASIVLLATMSVIVAQSNDSLGGRIAAALDALPIPRWLVAAMLNLPSLVLLVALFAVSAPPAVAVIHSASGQGVLMSLVVVAVAVLLGLLGGVVIWYGVRAVLVEIGATLSLAYPGAAAIWTAVAALGIWRMRGILANGSDVAEIKWFDFGLGWPILSSAIRADGEAAYVVLAVLLFSVAAWFSVRAALAHGLRIHTRTPRVRVEWTSGGPAPLTRLELLRIVRAQPTRSALFGAAFVALGSIISLAVWEGSTASLAPLLSWIIGLMCGQLGMRARGLSPRYRPYSLSIGIDPGKWSRAVAAAAWALAAAIIAPSLTAMGALTGSMDEALTFGLGQNVMIFSAAVVVGWVLLPGADNAGAEMLALWLISLAMVGIGQGLGNVPLLQSTAAFVAVTLVGSFAMQLLPQVLEKWRWHKAVGGLAPPD